MAEFDNSNRGALFHADKRGNEKAPDYRGMLDVNGVKYELAGWKRMSKAGQPYLSLTVQLPRERGASAGNGRPEVKDDTDIPF